MINDYQRRHNEMLTTLICTQPGRTVLLRDAELAQRLDDFLSIVLMCKTEPSLTVAASEFKAQYEAHARKYAAARIQFETTSRINELLSERYARCEG